MNRPDIPAPLSFDSRGINDRSDKYANRLFTLTFDRVNDPRCQALGKALAALPDLLAALERVLSRSPHIDQSATHEGLENCDMLAACRAALLKAGYTF